MSDVVFNILIPCTENATGIAHLPSKFDAWVLETADRFGGITTVGLALQGLWFDARLPREANPIEDHRNWCKVGVAPARVDELRAYARDTARSFGQKDEALLDPGAGRGDLPGRAGTGLARLQGRARVDRKLAGS